MPSVTRPKTVCFPSKKGAGAVVMKNFVGLSHAALSSGNLDLLDSHSCLDPSLPVKGK